MHTLDLVAIDRIVDFVHDDETHTSIIAAVPLIVPAYISRGGDHAILARRCGAAPLLHHTLRVLPMLIAIIQSYMFYMFVSIPVIGVITAIIGLLTGCDMMPIYISFTATIIVIIESHLYLAYSIDDHLTMTERGRLHRVLPQLVVTHDD